VVGNDDSFILGSSHGRYKLSDYNDRHQLRHDVSHNQRSSDEAPHRIKQTRRQVIGNQAPMGQTNSW
jgi:hypothetical protein